MKNKIYYYHEDMQDDFGTIAHNSKPLEDNA